VLEPEDVSRFKLITGMLPVTIASPLNKVVALIAHANRFEIPAIGHEIAAERTKESL
jgi:hypothetical protein